VQNIYLQNFHKSVKTPRLIVIIQLLLTALIFELSLPLLR